ncbi:hypothetical protein B0I33_10794 [Prauserella shujinwangii]|uniref:SalK n=1 Tax=Prauserella shujinwangii TaxID=1453103 RepID=A0A2T0LS70_9PSEU|nr:hypothetical protein [Prauserella shujinwangii]PRX46517.1 hypothetical protein B0I33_10794 [Prauserella shujinwangii]
MTADAARALWVPLETLHDVTYFTPRARAAHEAAGLRGFWRGYVATRAAPLGAVGVAAATAAFAGFAPSFLARTLPSIWEVVPPATALTARADGAVAALDEHVPWLREDSRLPEVLDVLRRLADAVPWTGRPLGAANAALDWPGDPVAALWQAATTLREHRGDGHVVAFVAEGLDGLEAHVLRDAVDGSRELMLPNRGWTERDWAAAADRLTARGLLAAGGGLTARGRALREHLERRTDQLAAAPYGEVTAGELARVDELLRPAARELAAAGAVPFPNPVGVPAP